MNQYLEKAQWIMYPCDKDAVVNTYFECTKTFEGNTQEQTTLYISASTQYAVYVNGAFVNCGQYEGYEDYQVYDTLDLTPYVKDGENTLLIGHYVCGDNGFSTKRKLKPGLLFAVWNGETQAAYSDTNCMYRENAHFLPTREKITVQMAYTFEYDATATETAFVPAVLAEKEKHLYPRPIKKLDISEFEAAEPRAYGLFMDEEKDEPKAVRMKNAFLRFDRYNCFRKEAEHTMYWVVGEERQKDGVYMIFDLKRECTGLLEFELDVEEDCEVLIGYGEHLDDLRVRTHMGGRNFCFRYMAKAGKNHFFYPYQRLGLRYLQFHVYNTTGRLRAGIRHQMYPLTKYPCTMSDHLYQRIYEVGTRTLECCMHEHYEDCPWREQALYAMDSRVQMLCGYYAFKEYDFARASLDLMRRSLREDNLLVMCAPSDIKTNIPSFTAVYVRQVLEYVQYSKDQAFLAEAFDVLQRIVDGFAARIESNHLVANLKGYWNFYEWTPGMDGNRPEDKVEEALYDAPLNAFISDAFACFAKICEIYRPELAEKYENLHQELNKALHEQFFDPEHGAYLSRIGDEAPRHALTQGLLLFADAVPEEYKAQVCSAITDGSLIAASISMTIYVYEALLKQGDCYKEYIMADIRKVWGKMLNAGADTFWETEKGADDFAYAGSLCHGWSAVPIYIWGRYFSE